MRFQDGQIDVDWDKDVISHNKKWAEANLCVCCLATAMTSSASSPPATESFLEGRTSSTSMRWDHRFGAYSIQWEVFAWRIWPKRFLTSWSTLCHWICALVFLQVAPSTNFFPCSRKVLYQTSMDQNLIRESHNWHWQLTLSWWQFCRHLF